MLISLETDATEVASYNEELVTGLAQTEAYHRALFDIGDAWEPAVVEQSIAVRKERQARFWGKADIRFTCVMSELALTHCYGGLEVLEAQVEHLLELAERPGVEVRVLASGRGGHMTMSGAFTLLTGRFGKVAYMENLDGGRTVKDKKTVGRFERAGTLAMASSIDLREFVMTTPWIKSERSAQSGQCVEQRLHAGRIELRDSKAPHEASLSLTTSSYALLLHSAKAGELDLP